MLYYEYSLLERQASPRFNPIHELSISRVSAVILLLYISVA